MPPQLPLSRLSPGGLLSFPYRLCNPPPAVGKVRSCGVTPLLNVRLEDVLARRHLPPIGLKDLEEYLLYVERTPENLYFILWLKDYTARYHAWVQREKLSLFSKKEKLSKTQHQKFSIPPTPDQSLAMFYLRAKQTFFTPHGQYELNIPSDVLAPFHCTPPQDHSRPSLWHSQSIHPDPAVFSEVAMEAQSMLNESLKRFVRAAYTNVGSQRAICGIIAGCVFTLVSGTLPLIMTTGRWNLGPHTRLIRLAAFPGLWFGLTVLIASLQGICLMIYFFGDLRQLRKFELARPTISRPIPIPDVSPMPPMSTSRGQPLFVPSRHAPMPEKTTESPTAASHHSPTPYVPPAPRFAQSTTSLTESCESCQSECSSGRFSGIDVSPAFFDDVPAPEGPATASCLHRPEYRLSPSLTYVEPAHVRSAGRSAGLNASADGPTVGQKQSRRGLGAPEYGPTAGFIPSDYPNASTTSLERSLRTQRSAYYFDFDTLPAHGRHGAAGDGLAPVVTHMPPLSSAATADPPSPHTCAPSSASSPTLAGALGRAQYKCESCPTAAFLSTFEDDASELRPRRRKFSLAMLIPSFTAGVPAFATPLTPVQSPVVKRAQWEVVVRAALVAAVLAGGLMGIVIGAVP